MGQARAATGMRREGATALRRAALFAARRSVAPHAACLQSAHFATAKPAEEKEPLQPSTPNHIIVTVNDKQVEILKGATVMAACEAAGIDIPRHVSVVQSASVFSSAGEQPALIGQGWRAQVLLPPAPVHRWQLPHVPGGGVLATLLVTV